MPLLIGKLNYLVFNRRAVPGARAVDPTRADSPGVGRPIAKATATDGELATIRKSPNERLTPVA